MADPLANSGRRTFIADVWPEFYDPPPAVIGTALAQTPRENNRRRLRRRKGTRGVKS